MMKSRSEWCGPLAEGEPLPKVLIIGHGRHGKDTVAQMISDSMGLKFSSSSEFVGRKCIWPNWGKSRYQSFEAMFADRVNHRATWGDLIEAYNTPDAHRTGSEMIEDGNDMYVGMRRARELEACRWRKVFDHVIWVDATLRLPLEPLASMELTPAHADIHVNNNGPVEDLVAAVANIQKHLHFKGYEVNFRGGGA